MSILTRLFGSGAAEDRREDARPLWEAVVAEARQPDWYAAGGVADTVPGRFDAVTLVLALVMLRMERDKASDDRLIAPSVRLTELFVEDMDGQLRQSGVGDLVVGKRMGKLMSVLGGRLVALREALADANPQAALLPVIERNVTTSPDADRGFIAARIVTLHQRLDGIDDDALMAGRISA